MLKKLLGFDSTTMTLRTESIAGITTFLTMSYILAVNTSILSSTGMDKGCRVHGYRSCHRPLHPVACLHGKAALGTGTQHGDQCLLRLHTGTGYGLPVASGYGCLVCGGAYLHSHHFLQRARDCAEQHTCHAALRHLGRYRDVHRLYRTKERRHHRLRPGYVRDVRPLHARLRVGIDRHPAEWLARG